MHPDLQRYFTHVLPLFWPWLVWNLVRVARWHARTGREALMAVDCFGNIRLVCLADAPPPDDLYTYEAPRIPRWERSALCSDVPVCVRASSAQVRYDPVKSGIVIYSHDIVRISPVQYVRGPP
ncbi:hypothetical protein [Hyphomonas jannaschiana]|uniref:hypothetical protein n=1 Tax=Hyphomonas jannaschiana TaxID=86 RepID=UPI0035C702F7